MKIQNPKPRFFTGIQASGNLTLGNYFGVIQPLLKIQDDYEVIIMIADLHALTVPKPSFDYRIKCYEIASLLYACGLKEDNCKIFIQSEIKEHLELTWLMAPFATVSELNNMIQYKEKKKGQETGNLALLSYPVLMAADIFLYDADLIIVGQDQKQHLELAVNIAQKFNKFCGQDLLKIPQFTIPPLGAKIMGLKNPTKKMSKSENDYLSLLDGPATIEKKIKGAETDSENKIYYDPEKKPGISNLLTIYSLLVNKEIAEIETELTHLNYFEFKICVIELLNKQLVTIRTRYNYFLGDIKNLLKKNSGHLKNLAKQKTLSIKKELKM